MNQPIPFGKYYLLDRINAGGMAEVFRAKAFGVEGFERVVAVKRILPNIAADTDFITMFIDEAKLAVQLNHANIAQIFDLGKVNDSYFIALEYVHGKDLRALFDNARQGGVRVPPALAAYVLMKTCEGLDYAHNKRDASGRPLELVHRDVSPQNVIVSFDGDVKLIDFGIAKAVGKASRTRAGILKGKFGYLSPEQVRGEPIDRRSDMFAAGIVLYELLTGERLFAGDSDFSAIEKVRSVEITTPEKLNPDIPQELSQIVMQALCRDKQQRFQTAMEMHDALQRFLYARGEPFTRRDLSAYMRAHFPLDADNDQEAVGDLQGVDAMTVATTDLTPVAEPTESSAVIDETRDIPSEGSSKHASTLLGMPVPVRPSGGRSMPPPPPRGDSGAPPSFAARTAPPAPPARTVPPVPPARTAPPPPPRTVPPVLPRAATVPPGQLAAVQTPSPGTVPPGSERAVTPMGQRTLPPGAQGSMYSAPAAAATSSDAPASNPLLNMDWDDDELSTQVYDKPEDQYDDVSAPGPSFYEGGSYGAAAQPGYAGQPPQGYAGQAPQGYAGQVAQPAQGYGAPQGYPQSQNGFNPNGSQPVGYGAPPGGYSANAYGYGPGQEAQVPTYVPPPPGDYAGGYGVYATGPVAAPGPQQAMGYAQPAPMPEPSLDVRSTHVTSTTSTQGSEKGRSTSLYALAVGGVVMLCFFAYLFLAKTEPGVVQLTTHPTDATVLFDGKPVGTSSPFLVTGVVPGDKHRLEVQKDGYRPWSQDVQVQPGQNLQFPVTLEPVAAAAGTSDTKPASTPSGAVGAVGAFIIESTPPGAKVFLDGQDLNAMTPVRIGNLLPRSYQVRVVLDGYREQTVAAQVEPSMDVTLPRVVLAPSRVHVRVVSEPSGAEAAIVRGAERRDLGRTPVDVTIDNDGNAWTLEVQRSGYEPFSQPLSIEGGQKDLNVRANLARVGGGEPSTGGVEVSAVRTPRPSSSGSSRSASSNPAPSRAPAASNDASGASSGSSASAEAGGPGTLRINSRPWSQVTIDGKSYGNTPQMNISLPAGAHKVLLVNPEFGIRKTITVQIKPGKVETQIVALQ